MNRVAVPPASCQLAHTAAGDVARLTSTLNGSTTHAALVLAESARQRAMTNLRDLGPVIRQLRREAAKMERVG